MADIVTEMMIERKGTLKLLFVFILLSAFLAGVAGGLSFTLLKAFNLL